VVCCQGFIPPGLFALSFLLGAAQPPLRFGLLSLEHFVLRVWTSYLPSLASSAPIWYVDAIRTWRQVALGTETVLGSYGVRYVSCPRGHFDLVDTIHCLWSRAINKISRCSRQIILLTTLRPVGARACVSNWLTELALNDQALTRCSHTLLACNRRAPSDGYQAAAAACALLQTTRLNQDQLYASDGPALQ
jgi:hypothetical protein